MASSQVLNALLSGKYELSRLLGEGGMGSVYEAVHIGTGRRVAVKVINLNEVKLNQEVIARFHREARATGAIDSQHVAAVLDVGQDPQGALYLVMEYLTGEDLQALLNRLGPFPPDLALRIAAQVCIGLQKAHEVGVVHRDIKPANLFLSRRDGEVIVKLLDFGVAKVKADQMTFAGLTRTGSVLGTPYYLSPEQAKGQRDVDHRADLWSIGIVLYAMLTGRPPHAELDMFGALVIAICTEPPKPVQDLAPWVSTETASIVHAALQIDPNHRFSSAHEMLQVLRTQLTYGFSIFEDMLVPLSPELRRPDLGPTDLPSIPNTERGDDDDDDEPPTIALPFVERHTPIPSPARPELQRAYTSSPPAPQNSALLRPLTPPLTPLPPSPSPSRGSTVPPSPALSNETSQLLLKPGRFDQLLKEATSAYLRRDYDLALSLFEECRVIRPDDRRTLHNISRIKGRKAGG